MTVPPIHLYDTRRRAVVPFEPVTPGKASIYTCGPTVYGPQHLGNMRSQLLPDLLRRVLDAAGYDVTFVTNVTDVGHLVSDADEGEDKVEAAAAKTGQTVEEITGHWTEQWANDRRRLGMLEPDLIPYASKHIGEQIAMIQTLEAQGRTYVIDDGVYFDTSTYPEYADFAHLNLDDLEATGRVENVSDKRHPADFALWKLSGAGSTRLQEWDSPWGVGFPGWHIECSAMATKYLGRHFDIHTGGIDHVRVHHTNEVAQSECALEQHPWVNIWMHNEFLDVGNEKMSKSKGHVLTVDTLVDEGIDPLAFRYFFFQAHYRQQQNFTIDLVRSADRALDRLHRRAGDMRGLAEKSGALPNEKRMAPHRAAFWGSLADDLNGPRALAAVWGLWRDPELSEADIWALIVEFDSVLALGLSTALPRNSIDMVSLEVGVQDMLADREQARLARDYAAADDIRDRLAGLGYEIIDTPDGPTVRHTDH